MYLQTVFELTLVLDKRAFICLMNNAYDTIKPLEDNEYVDRSLDSKGVTVVYRDSRYKKKVKRIVKPSWILDDDEPDPDKLIRKLEKRIDGYFNSKYRLEDFTLTGMVLSTDIDVHNRENVAAYIKILQRIGKVKGFSPTHGSCPDDDNSFCLDGNSNGTQFMICDLEKLLMSRSDEGGYGRKELKSLAKKAEGLLRAEVRLTKLRTVQAYTDETDTTAQIADLSGKGQDVFLDTFTRIVPFGDFYKKDKVAEIIRREVTDKTLRRRMLRLVELIPKKKSLLLAQKALNYRRIDDVMEALAGIEVSPVTIGKRQGVKWLESLYKYM